MFNRGFVIEAVCLQSACGAATRTSTFQVASQHLSPLNNHKHSLQPNVTEDDVVAIAP